MGNLDPTRAEGERHIDHVAEPIEVLPMDHQRERQRPKAARL
jgi:hypothetical protein